MLRKLVARLSLGWCGGLFGALLDRIETIGLVNLRNLSQPDQALVAE
jgi:hypothetical protein